MTISKAKGRSVLEKIARRVMQERGFLPDFSPEALGELEEVRGAVTEGKHPGKDMRDLPWASIDNDDSMDLDQLTVAEALPDNGARIFVAVADVETLVRVNSAIDTHARQNATSVYTAGKTFPMLPEGLSTDLTSLNQDEDRLAMVIEVSINEAGEMQGSSIYPAVVRNHAKLAYNSLADWLEGRQPAPEAVAAVPALADNLRLQDSAAQRLRAGRYKRGALDLQTLEARPVFSGDEIKDLQLDVPNRAKELIEDFMIAANDVTARFLQEQKVPSLRRVVRSPERWNRIVEIAVEYGSHLPAEADSTALARFLTEQKAADPLRFPDLSLSIIKLLGPGEYVVELPGEVPAGHFGLAVKDYTHSTAPNRRFPDLITQRVLKATLAGQPMPYGNDELAELAKHCTQKEDDANKVERSVAKSAAAMLLSTRIGERFDALCTGAADKGTWVRIFSPPAEGRLVHGFDGVDVGSRLVVRLIHTDVDKGFIDFEKVTMPRRGEAPRRHRPWFRRRGTRA